MPGIIRRKSIRKPVSHDREPSSVWSARLSFQKRHAALISVVGIGAMIALGLGVAKLQASVRIETLFGNESRLINDYALIEENVGHLVPIEVIVEFNDSDKTPASDRLATLDRVQSRLLADDEVQAITSFRDFMPPSRFPLTGDFASQYLESVQNSVSEAGYLKDSGSSQRWRITAHTSVLGELDYGRIIDKLQTSVDSDLAVGSDFSSVEIELSGLMPLVH
jgi:predicted RND superfamily exporter protein